jgi:hypothetical protein
MIGLYTLERRDVRYPLEVQKERIERIRKARLTRLKTLFIFHSINNNSISIYTLVIHIPIINYHGDLLTVLIVEAGKVVSVTQYVLLLLES